VEGRVRLDAHPDTGAACNALDGSPAPNAAAATRTARRDKATWSSHPGDKMASGD
jgi:hypothetical protein